MALHVVLGFQTRSAQSPVSSLYCGSSSSEALAARDKFKGSRTLWLRNPDGIRKFNAEAAAADDAARNLAELTSQPVYTPTEEEDLARKLEFLERENARLKSGLEKSESILDEVEKEATRAEELPFEAPAPKATPEPDPEPEEPEPSKENRPDPAIQAAKDAARKQAAAAAEAERAAAEKAATPSDRPSVEDLKKRQAEAAAEKPASKKSGK